MNAQLRESEPRIGIFTDEPANVYHQRRLDEASASGLKQMLRSPAHFRHYVENPEDDKQSPALTFGSALHCAVLEPDVFARRYVVLPADAPRYPTDAQWNAKGQRAPDSQKAVDFWTAWNAENTGRERLSAADYDKVRRMADSAMAHPVARGLLMGGDREVTMRWKDADTGIDCKARADLFASGEFLMDLKSCRDASPEGFARAVTTYQYGLQAAHYLSGIQANGDAIKWFVFLAVESSEPYVCQPYILDAQAESLGFNQRRKAITKQAECLSTGHWPGYSLQLEELRLPAFAYYGEDSQ